MWHNTAISEVFSGWNISAWAFWLLQAIRTFSSEISSKKNYSNKAQGGKGKIVSWGETNSPGGQHIRARGGSSAKNSLLQHSLSNSVTTNINYPPSAWLPLSTVWGTETLPTDVTLQLVQGTNFTALQILLIDKKCSSWISFISLLRSHAAASHAARREARQKLRVPGSSASMAVGRWMFTLCKRRAARVPHLNCFH